MTFPIGQSRQACEDAQRAEMKLWLRYPLARETCEAHFVLIATRKRRTGYEGGKDR